MKLRPLHDNVLVKRTEEEETSSGGIILSGSAKEKPSQGEVVAVGPGKVSDSGESASIPSGVPSGIVGSLPDAASPNLPPILLPIDDNAPSALIPIADGEFINAPILKLGAWRLFLILDVDIL